jgi:hypothetical protein
MSVGIAKDNSVAKIFRLSVVARDFSVLNNIHTGSRAQPASYTIGNGGSFPGGWVAGTWSWSLTSIQCQSQEFWNYTFIPSYILMVFLFEYWGGGVYTGSTRHCGHPWPIVSAPGDCEHGEVGGVNEFGRGNWSTRRKHAPTPLCPPQIPLTRPGREPGPPHWEASD